MSFLDQPVRFKKRRKIKVHVHPGDLLRAIKGVTRIKGRKVFPGEKRGDRGVG